MRYSIEDVVPNAVMARAPWLHRERRLASTPGDAAANWSVRRLNLLAAGIPDCTTYLEVGVPHGYTFENVVVPFKWGVDPFPLFKRDRPPPGVRVSVEESDSFFARLKPQVHFDLVFLDGLHEWRQTYRDLVNTLEHTRGRSLIVIDDVVPIDEFSAHPDLHEALAARQRAGFGGQEWHGDVFKVLLAIRDRHPELSFRVIDDATGNPQAIVWRTKGEVSVAPVDPEPPSPDAYVEVGYWDVFPDGRCPAEFLPGEEADVIRSALGAIRTVP